MDREEKDLGDGEEKRSPLKVVIGLKRKEMVEGRRKVVRREPDLEEAEERPSRSLKRRRYYNNASSEEEDRDLHPYEEVNPEAGTSRVETRETQSLVKNVNLSSSGGEEEEEDSVIIFDEKTGQEKMRCPAKNCSSRFGEIPSLKAHINNKNKGHCGDPDLLAKIQGTAYTKAFKCPVCKMRFSTTGSRSRHCNKFGHLLGEGVLCPYCPIALRVPIKLLMRHCAKVHPGQPLYPCFYIKNSNLLLSSPTDHKCKEFNRSVNRDYHIVCHHRERDIPCERCPRMFPSRGQMNWHILQEHDREIFECDICDIEIQHHRHYIRHLCSRSHSIASRPERVAAKSILPHVGMTNRAIGCMYEEAAFESFREQFGKKFTNIQYCPRKYFSKPGVKRTATDGELEYQMKVNGDWITIKWNLEIKVPALDINLNAARVVRERFLESKVKTLAPLDLGEGHPMREIIKYSVLDGHRYTDQVDRQNWVLEKDGTILWYWTPVEDDDKRKGCASLRLTDPAVRARFSARLDHLSDDAKLAKMTKYLNVYARDVKKEELLEDDEVEGSSDED